MAVKLRLLPSYLDESTDGVRKEAFCIGAFPTDELHLKPMQDAWVKRLKSDDIAYFKACDCKGVSGRFAKLRQRYSSLDLARKAAADIRLDLENILLSSHWIGFGLCVDVPEYINIRQAIPASKIFYSEDPTIASYSQMVYSIARAVRTNAPDHLAAYVIDDSNYSSRIAEAYAAVKQHHPVIAKTMTILLPLDDKITLPLQMADLVASVVKDSFLNFKSSGKSSPEKWDSYFKPIGIWDAEHTARTLRRILSSRRFATGKLVRQRGPKPGRRDIKRQRREAIARALNEKKHRPNV